MVGAIRFSVPLEPIEREVDLSEAKFSIPGVFSDKTLFELTQEFLLPNFEEDLEKILKEFFQEFEEPQDTSLISTPTNDSLLGTVTVGNASMDFDEINVSDADRNGFDVLLFNTNNPETVAIDTDEFAFDDFSIFLDLTDDKSTQELTGSNFADSDLGNEI
jgi:hypothetical protein